MAKYGAFFGRTAGFGWMTPDSTPMHFAKRIELSVTVGSAVQYIDTGISGRVAMIPFIQMHTDPGIAVYFDAQVKNGTWQICAASPLSGTFTARVYCFHTVIPQPLPKYGCAIFNSAGQCILTNETNPLRILESITLRAATLGVPAQTKTYAGRSIAVYPTSTGYTIGNIQNPPGPPLIVQSFHSYRAVRQGGGTLLAPGAPKSTPGNVNNWFSPLVQTYVIDTSFYD